MLLKVAALLRKVSARGQNKEIFQVGLSRGSEKPSSTWQRQCGPGAGLLGLVGETPCTVLLPRGVSRGGGPFPQCRTGQASCEPGLPLSGPGHQNLC